MPENKFKIGITQGDTNGIGWEIILKALADPRYFIIDILEVGDYINGYRVSSKGYDYVRLVQCDYPVENGTTIKSVVTKEQFKNMEHRIGE